MIKRLNRVENQFGELFSAGLVLSASRLGGLLLSLSLPDLYGQGDEKAEDDGDGGDDDGHDSSSEIKSRSGKRALPAPFSW